MRIFFSWKNNRKETSEEKWKRRKNYAPKALVGGAKRKERDELEHVCLWGSGLASVDVCMRVACSPIQPTSPSGQGGVREIPSHVGTYKRHSHMRKCMYVCSEHLVGTFAFTETSFSVYLWKCLFFIFFDWRFHKEGPKRKLLLFSSCCSCQAAKLEPATRQRHRGQIYQQAIDFSKEEKSGGATAEQHVETNKNKKQRIQIKELENQKKNFVREKAAKTGKKTKLRRM